jgi:hypothetical protein
VEVPGLTTSTDDMKLGVLFLDKRWMLRQQISRQMLVLFSTDGLWERAREDCRPNDMDHW